LHHFQWGSQTECLMKQGEMNFRTENNSIPKFTHAQTHKQDISF